jgi:hypothetical protein
MRWGVGLLFEFLFVFAFARPGSTLSGVGQNGRF